MSKSIVRFLAILGALWLAGMVIMLVAVIGTKGKVPSKTILEANFEQSFIEDAPATPAAQLTMTDRATLRDVVDAIDRGAGDDRVVGMIAQDRRCSDGDGADAGNPRRRPKIPRT